MGRRDREPIVIARFSTRDEAEAAWMVLVDGGVPSVVVTDDPPWGEPAHLIQCARNDAEVALELLQREA